MAKHEHTFKPGDKVRLVNGKLPLTITYITSLYVYAKYDHNNQRSTESYKRFIHYETGETQMTKDAIYKVDLDARGSTFASYRGTDSAGNWLMERIGDGGGIMIVAKDKCEEVLPYTFSVRMNGREHHFQGEAGKLKKGDILLYTAGGVDNFTFAIVKNIDTKQKSAKVWEGVRVNTEAI